MTRALIYGDGGFSILRDDAAIRQRVLERMQFFLGEWFLDLDDGVPYVQSIIGSSRTSDIARVELADAAQQVESVLSARVTRMERSADNPGLTDVDMELETVLGQTTLSFAIVG